MRSKLNARNTISRAFLISSSCCWAAEHARHFSCYFLIIISMAVLNTTTMVITTTCKIPSFLGTMTTLSTGQHSLAIHNSWIRQSLLNLQPKFQTAKCAKRWTRNIGRHVDIFKFDPELGTPFQKPTQPQWMNYPPPFEVSASMISPRFLI